MRLIGIMIGGTLFAAVVAQGFFLVRANRRIEKLSHQIEDLQNQADQGAGHFEYPERSAAALERDPEEDPTFNPPPPGFLPALQALAEATQEAGGWQAVAAAADHDLPLPPLLSSPEAREQLRTFVRAQLVQEKQAEQEQRAQRIAERETTIHDEVANKLGLDAHTAAQFSGILSNASEQRRDILNRTRAGNLVGQEVHNAMADLTRSTNDSLKQLLGGERFKQYQSAARESGLGRGGFGRGRRGADEATPTP